MSKIQLYTNPMSRGRVAHWILEEVGAEYETHILDFKKAEHKSPTYLKINPMGKVPAIVHNGTVITETAAICAYLADAFPKAGLAPAATDPARGTYLRWLFFAASCVEPAALDKALNRPVGEKGHMGYGSYEDTFNTLELALKPGPFILGSKFSAADVYISSQLSWLMMTKAIEKRPTFEKYVAACVDRPANKRMNEQAQAFS